MFSKPSTVYKTQGNYNNEIGLPYTASDARRHLSEVIEMGMSDWEITIK